MTGFVNPDGSALVGGLLPSGVGQAFNSDVLGNLTVQEWVAYQIVQAKSFVGSTGVFSSGAGTNNYPIALFNPANSGKSIYLYSLHTSTGTGSSTAYMINTVADPAYNTAITPVNLKNGGAASAIATHVTWNNANVALSGTYTQVEINTQQTEFLPDGQGILLPSGSANGVTVWLQVYSAGFCSLCAKWIEF